MAFFHLALAAAEIRARPSALILRLFLVGVVCLPFILAHLARAAAAMFALPAADIRRRFLPTTSDIVVSTKMDASCVSSCSICSLIATASRSCATLKLLRGLIKALVVKYRRDWVNERDCQGLVVIERHESFGHKEPMMRDGMKAAQRLAIQKLIRAKSDREIARLLRKSHRLLNLHCRRRTGGPHSERWTDYELRLVGRIRDEELAKLLRRTPGAVAAKRESLDIPIFSPQRIRWSSREIELLGKRPDFFVARMLGRTRYAVQLKRHSLNIPQCWENRRAWTSSEDALLGTMRDAELAQKLKRSVLSVRSRRNDNTSIRFIQTPKRWTLSELRLLGRLPDAEIARRSRRFLASVRNKRKLWHCEVRGAELTRSSLEQARSLVMLLTPWKRHIFGPPF
ncbi:MAG TPA: hypothetical protein VH595_04575 [Verrucomicrobiae bacterium]|nr:hypothetical protein [Verrucomicrobiae bacterium]